MKRSHVLLGVGFFFFICLMGSFSSPEKKQVAPAYIDATKSFSAIASANAQDQAPVDEQLEKAEPSEEFRVQAILNPRNRAVIASPIDAIIASFNVDDGSLFKKEDVLVEYDCSLDEARLREAKARQRVSQAQFDAYKKLHALKSASEIEYISARENNNQNMAVVQQIEARLNNCKIIAPFDGRVTKKIASQYEFVQTGRVLMDISSRENLRAEFLVSSSWLRWLNIDTPLTINIAETDKDYSAKIVRIHGEVDPVSQFVQVVAEMENYHEELLPGMSGFAIFNPETTKQPGEKGFLGVVLGPVGEDIDGTNP